MTQLAVSMNADGVEWLPTAVVTDASDGSPIRFGQWQALPAARTLLRNGRPVELGGRAFDLLIVLLRSRGELVAKEDIVRHVWPTTIVEESNLRFQMAVLRKALGKDRALIKTVPGRGYMLIADNPTAASRHAEAQAQPRADQAKKSAIFIVEADQDVREALSRLLRPINAQVISFRSIDALLETGGCVA